MLLALEPGARVYCAIRSFIDTEAVAFVELVESLIAPTVGIVLHTEAIGLLVLPLTGELTAICPSVSAETL